MRYLFGGLAAAFCLLVLFVAPSAQAASFSCAKASTAREKAICASPALSHADEELAAAYKAALARSGGGWPEALRASQRWWLRDQARTCRADAACLLRDYELRIAYLRHPALIFTGRYVQGRCPNKGFYLDATPIPGEGKLEVMLYACPDPAGNVYLQASGMPDVNGVMVVQDNAQCQHQLIFGQDTITVKAMQGPVCGIAYQANGVFTRDPAKSPYEGD